MVLRLGRRTTRPSPGHVRATQDRLCRLQEAFEAFAQEARNARALLVNAEKQLDQLDDALERGDLDAAKRISGSIRNDVKRAQGREERTGTLADSFAGMLKHLRLKLRRIGL